MQPQPPPHAPLALDAFVALVGPAAWVARMSEIAAQTASGPRAGRLACQRHALELSIERLRGTPRRPPSLAELQAAQLAAQAVRLSVGLRAPGRIRLQQRLRLGLKGRRTLVPFFH